MEALWVWLLSLSVFSGLICVGASISTLFFLWLDPVPLYGYTALCFFIHQLMDIWVVSTFWLL